MLPICAGAPDTGHDADYLTEGEKFNLPGITDRAYVNLGYSSFTVLVVLVVAIVAATLPLTFSMRMKGNMVLCRGSSAVISASCHSHNRVEQAVGCPISPYPLKTL